MHARMTVTNKASITSYAIVKFMMIVHVFVLSVVFTYCAHPCCFVFVFFQTADYLRTHTYAHVPGNKYPLLIQYYTLLEQCIEQGATVKVSQN